MGLVLLRGLVTSSPPIPKPVIQAATEAGLLLPAPTAARKPRAPSPPATAAQEEDAKALAVYSPAAEDQPEEVPSAANLEQTAIREPVPVSAAVAPGYPPGEAPNKLSGDWIFVPAAETVKSGYPPEFIELRLREHEGAMRGSYRARYRVADRAISPSVAFQFEGRAGTEGSVLPWSGPGGSQGEVTLRLLANGKLRVVWEAARLGEELGLISGAATLVRKLE
jgi:hypothetical protein